MEIEREMMAWFTHVPINWIGFTYENEHLSYMNLFLLFFLLLPTLAYSVIYVILLLGYIIALIVFIYKKMNDIPEEILTDSWHKLRQFLARFLIKWGKIMHDHEIIGMEHLPKEPGIIVFYHGTMDVDYVLLICNIYMQRRKMCITVTDKWLINMPGMKSFFDMAGCICGNKAKCVEMLKKGCFLGIAPGGGREAVFSDQYYRLIWSKRTGFAQVALEAKVPIIPVFTQNIQEAFRGFGRTRLVRWLYEKTRCFGIPVFGSFPVKLRTYIGEPIPYDPDITAVELAEKTKAAIENLRDQYQKIPGNILRALSERFHKHPKDD